MRVICAPDSFKEALSARRAAEAMARGVRGARPGAEVDVCPVADGGEGTVEAIVAATGGRRRITRVMGPLGSAVEAEWGLLPDGTAVIEMAAASGLALVPEGERDPERTTTYGTGELVRAAAGSGAERILLGIGGSATCDGAAGMAQALGARLLDERGRVLPPPIGGAALRRVARVEAEGLDPRVAALPTTVACDVDSPLLGPKGAARVFAPQKGATPEQVERLEAGLRALSAAWRALAGYDVGASPGAGAAGGLGAGLLALLGAELAPGSELVLRAVGFDRRVAGCALCLTGEGRLDGQSMAGKACIGVARAARAARVDAYALVGAAGPEADRCHEAGLTGYRVIGAGLSHPASLAETAELIEAAAAEIARERLGPLGR